MLTPQEVAEHAFSKASFGGYNMAMVDEFLETGKIDYTDIEPRREFYRNVMSFQ